jgi:hypothetical protein
MSPVEIAKGIPGGKESVSKNRGTGKQELELSESCGAHTRFEHLVVIEDMPARIDHVPLCASFTCYLARLLHRKGAFFRSFQIAMFSLSSLLLDE